MSLYGDSFARSPFLGSQPGGLCSYPSGAAGAPSSVDFRNFSGLKDYTSRSQGPVTTGSSVVAIKFDRGVMIAADLLASYGTMARYRDCPRVVKLNKNIIVAADGDYADFQYLKEIMERKISDEQCLDDGMEIKPLSMHCWLTRVLYNRRSKFDPLWNKYVVAGMQDGKPYLGFVDMIGTAYEDNCIATGLGTHLCTPLLREYIESGKVLDEAKAKELVVKCMEVLFYRDAKAFSKFQLGIITADKCVVESPLELKHEWGLAHMISGYK